MKEEYKQLRKEIIRSKEEIKRIQSVPLCIGQFQEMISENMGLVSSTNGYSYYARVLSILDREKLKTNATIGMHKSANTVVDILPPEADSTIQMMQVSEKPDVT